MNTGPDLAGIGSTRPVLAGAARVLRLLGRAAIDAVFPPACIACGKAVDRSMGLCASCWRALAFIERPYCERLGIPFAQDLGAGLLSAEALSRPPVCERIRAAVRFEDGPARILVHRLKYGDRLELARPLGSWMARAGRELLEEADVIVPIPLHRGRLFTRQFNQAALLAAQVSRLSGRPWDPLLLRRVKNTPSQVGMTRAQRLDNLQGAFRAAADRGIGLADRRVLLIDDVLTTGATLNAAARAVLRGGAAAVDALVFARVVTIA